MGNLLEGLLLRTIRADSTLAVVSKTILIAPFEGPCAEALAAAASAAGWRLALALRGPRKAAVSEAGMPALQAGTALLPTAAEQAPVSLPWNPGSAISASALLLAARTALGELDAAVILSDRGAPAPDLLATQPGILASAIEEAVTGPALLIREIAKRFDTRRAGRLLLLQVEAPELPPVGPLAALGAGAFIGLGEGLFAAQRESPWACYGIQERSGKPDIAAKFALRLLEEPKPTKAGRWLSFTGKPGLFGVF